MKKKAQDGEGGKPDPEIVATLARKLGKDISALFEELLERNVHAIASELLLASDAAGGCGFRFGFHIIGGKVAVESKVSWSRKFTDEEESAFSFADPNQPELEGMDEDDTKITITAGDKSVETDWGGLKRAAKRVSRDGAKEAKEQ